MTLHQSINSMVINRPGRFLLHTQTVNGQQEREFTNALDLLSAAKTFAKTQLFGGLQRSTLDMMYVQAGDKRWTWTPADQHSLRGLEGTPNFLIWRPAA